MPKTGTTSIQRRLVDVDPGLLRNRVHDKAGILVNVPTHASALEIRKIMGARAKEFTFIAFLRDPRDLLVSKYHFYRSGRAARKHGLRQAPRVHLGITLRVLSAQILPLPLWARFYPFPSSTSYISDGEGKLIVERLGLTENLQEDMTQIFKSFGYTSEQLQLSIVNRTEYKRTHDPKINAIAVRRLPEDCALFDRIRDTRN